MGGVNEKFAKPEVESFAISISCSNDADHSLVASIPLVDYALLVKGKDAQLSDQDYLDYRDDYSMVLFLDPDYRWISTEIYINSWKIVNQDAEI